MNNPPTFLFRRSIPHHCATFPIRQETAVRDVSHPAADDDKLDNNRRQRPEGCDSCLIKSLFLSGGRVRWGALVQRGRWRGQETEGDGADTAISQRMLGGFVFHRGFKCGEGEEFNVKVWSLASSPSPSVNFTTEWIFLTAGNQGWKHQRVSAKNGASFWKISTDQRISSLFYILHAFPTLLPSFSFNVPYSKRKHLAQKSQNKTYEYDQPHFNCLTEAFAY